METGKQKADKNVSEYINRANEILKVVNNCNLGGNDILEVAKMIQIEEWEMVSN